MIVALWDCVALQDLAATTRSAACRTRISNAS
jgi:hypothetical protein